jgi:MFS family permease
VLAIGLSAYALVLVAVGYAETRPELILYLFLFGFSGNMSNVAVNTQAVAVEGLYKRPIMASFHGVWSVAGFTAAFIGTFMIGRGIIPFYHFIAITLLIVSLVIFFYQDTVKAEDKKTPGKVFVFPDKTLIRLGIIAFCTMICEGTMFDWSGVYFHKVIKAEGAWATAGYTAFMSTMAIGRFISDAFTYRFGSIRTLQLSGGLICTGLFIAVCFPNLPTGIVGFLLVGFGVSSVVPLVYSAAGNSTSMEVGMAITAVSTIGFFGFLIGPPLIGLVAGLSNLRISFSIVALMGLVIIKLSTAGKLKTQKESFFKS